MMTAPDEPPDVLVDSPSVDGIVPQPVRASDDINEISAISLMFMTDPD
jgi:hypothetical protein